MNFVSKIFLVTFLSCFVVSTYGQGGAFSFPSLAFNPSGYLNGQGGTGVSVLTDDPFAFWSNPAQLGSWSKSNNFATHFYTIKTPWFLSSYYQRNVSFNNQAGSIGYNFKSISRNLDLSIGLGYVNSAFDYGSYPFWADNDATILGYNNLLDIYRAYSIGFGLHSFVDLSFGFTYKHTTHYHPENPNYLNYNDGDFKTDFFDYGVLLTVPLHKYMLPQEIMVGKSSFSPFLDLSLGLARRNLGGDIHIPDRAQGDPVPRLANLGYSFHLGTDMTINNQEIRLLSINWTTEAERVLVNTSGGDTMSPKVPSNISGLGGISVIRNLIERKGDGDITCRHGFGLEICEIATISRGSFAGGHYNNNKTYGFSLKASGVVKLLNCLVQSPTLNYIAQHFDVQFHQGTQYYVSNPDGIAFPGLDYNGVVLLVRGFSFNHVGNSRHDE